MIFTCGELYGYAVMSYVVAKNTVLHIMAMVIEMKSEIIQGILVPFIGTTLGSACVFVLRKNINSKIGRILNGFAGGVMLASSVWSLIIPAIESSEGLGAFSFLPACVGFLLGIAMLIFIDRAFPYSA